MILLLPLLQSYISFFFFNDTATTEIYTLSLHDALPIWETRNGLARASSSTAAMSAVRSAVRNAASALPRMANWLDRKSTRLNSSHVEISYAVFCLKKKKIKYTF